MEGVMKAKANHSKMKSACLDICPATNAAAVFKVVQKRYAAHVTK